MLKIIYKDAIITGTGAVSQHICFSEEKGVIYMSHQKQARKVYYHVLEGSHFIIADERNKKKLLDIVLAIQRRENWAIYAFCITDDSAYFVTEADCPGSISRGAGSAAECFLQACRETVPYLPGISPVIRPGVMEELGSLEEIARRCRRIHRIPLDKGYVVRIHDYWWSSYITYIGQYDWGMVDCRVFSMYFSADPDLARARIQRFHWDSSQLI